MAIAPPRRNLKLVPTSRTPLPARTPTDDDIIRAFDRAEPGRGDKLYEHLIGAVEATLYRLLGRRTPDHDDLVQTVFERVLRTLREKRYAHACSLRSWAAAIACNVALNTLRRRRTERRVFEQDVPPWEEAHPAGTEDPERRTRLERAVELVREELSRMPAAQAEPLVLHDALGYELAEIAVLTGCSVAAAQSRLVRGRRELRRRLVAHGMHVEEVES